MSYSSCRRHEYSSGREYGESRAVDKALFLWASNVPTDLFGGWTFSSKSLEAGGGGGGSAVGWGGVGVGEGKAKTWIFFLEKALNKKPEIKHQQNYTIKMVFRIETHTK